VDGKPGNSFAFAAFEKQARRVSGVDDATAKKLARTRSWSMSPDHKWLLITINDDLYRSFRTMPEMERLTSSPGEKLEAQYSPDGRKIAFVRNHNLFVLDLD